MFISSVIAMRIAETSVPSLQGTWDISSSDRDGGDDTARERKDRKITNDVQSNHPLLNSIPIVAAKTCQNTF